MSVGRGGGTGEGLGPHWILKFDFFPITILTKRIVFIVPRGKNEISPFLALSGKIFLAASAKINPLLAPSLEKQTFRRPWGPHEGPSVQL